MLPLISANFEVLPLTKQNRPCLLAIAFCWLIIVLHAVLMPVQYDEAVTILSAYEHGPLSAFTHYEEGTNNHPILTLIIGILHRLNVSHVALFRVPSLLAAVAVLIAADRFAKGRPQAIRCLLPLLIVSVPLFFDYLALARGYALGLAFLMWAVLVFRRSFLASSLLFACSSLSVPTYALDVAIAGLALIFSAHNLLKVLTAISIAAVLSLVLYSAILTRVVDALLQVSGESRMLAVEDFILSLSGFGWWTGIGIVVLGVAIAGRMASTWNYIIVAFLLSMPLSPIGFARTHLSAAALLVLVLISSVPARRIAIFLLVLYCAGSLLTLRWDVIDSEPEVWAATGFSVARNLTSCLSVQKKGIFSIPHEFYEKIQGGPPFNADCPHFLMTSQPSLRIPQELHRHADVLARYNVELYRREDLNAFLRAIEKRSRISGDESK